MTMTFIRCTYGVPAKRGARIRYTDGVSKLGTITSAKGLYLRVLFDGERNTRILHPIWNVEYLAALEEGKP